MKKWVEGNYETIEFNLSCQGQANFEVFKDAYSYVPPHWHESLEIISVLEGELSVTVEQQQYQLRSGNCIILSPYALHSTVSVSGNQSMLLQIPLQSFTGSPAYFVNRQFICDPLSTDPEQKRRLGQLTELLRGIMELEQSCEPVDRLRSIGLLWELLYLLRVNFTRPATEAHFDRSSRKNRERLSSVIAYTQAHYREPITLEQAATELHLQVNYFCHFFKKNTGMTYLQFLNEYRLAKVYRDLIVTDIPLKYILERHGFTNYKRFRELFQEKFQATPNAVRTAHASARQIEH